MGKKRNYGGSEDSPDACFGGPSTQPSRQPAGMIWAPNGILQAEMSMCVCVCTYVVPEAELERGARGALDANPVERHVLNDAASASLRLNAQPELRVNDVEVSHRDVLNPAARLGADSEGRADEAAGADVLNQDVPRGPADVPPPPVFPCSRDHCWHS